MQPPGNIKKREDVCIPLMSTFGKASRTMEQITPYKQVLSGIINCGLHSQNLREKNIT